MQELDVVEYRVLGKEAELGEDKLQLASYAGDGQVIVAVRASLTKAFYPLQYLKADIGRWRYCVSHALDNKSDCQKVYRVQYRLVRLL